MVTWPCAARRRSGRWDASGRSGPDASGRGFGAVEPYGKATMISVSGHFLVARGRVRIGRCAAASGRGMAHLIIT
jgi:hypothetical protein